MLPLDLIGQRFGKLVVVERDPVRGDYRGAFWICKCDCGNTTRATTGNLRRENGTKSCGCGRTESIRAALTTHGLRHSDEYRIWGGIKNRCTNPKAHDYDRYGGRGITMCDEWKNDFAAFYQDMGPRPSKHHSVERRENDKGYCKENCYWATIDEQSNNRRNNVFYTHEGVSRTLSHWCRLLDLDYHRVYYRINRDGWSFEKAITTPTR